jgi:cytochrome P450
VKLSGKTFPAGTYLSICVMAVHKSEEFWEDAQCFNPDRFSEEVKQKDERHPFAYIPFSAGPHNCIG